MKDIKCPSCGKTFRIDPKSFEEILLQIKDEEFNKQIKQRLLLVEEDNKKALEILKRDVRSYVDRSKGIIQIRSAARLGQSDLGVNLRRVEYLFNQLENFN